MMINWWAIHYDPERYPEPHLFKPERFEGFNLSAAEESVHPDPEKRAHFAFGGGRRICPGMHVAERSLFINIARLLWGFNVDFKRDANGKKIPVDFGLSGLEPGSNTTPKPFACGISRFGCVNKDLCVRSPKHEQVLREQWDEAKRVGIDFTNVHFDHLLVE
jgi:hypothetical protein